MVKAIAEGICLAVPVACVAPESTSAVVAGIVAALVSFGIRQMEQAKARRDANKAEGGK